MIEVIVGVGGILNEIFDEEVINPEDKLCSAGVMSEQAWGGVEVEIFDVNGAMSISRGGNYGIEKTFDGGGIYSGRGPDAIDVRCVATIRNTDAVCGVRGWGL